MTPTTQFLLLILLLTLQTTLSSSSSSSWAETKATQQPPSQPQVQTILQFYFHDVEHGPNKTVTVVAKPENSSVNDFGRLEMIDNPLTEGIERDSKLLGRAQGTYAVATGSPRARRVVVMTMTLFFTEEEFAGSSINVFGRYDVESDIREMAVVGGTGAFRFASGYVLARKTRFSGLGDENTARFDAVVMHSQI